jgi:N-acetylmuramoyl-L-alanine amidase
MLIRALALALAFVAAQQTASAATARDLYERARAREAVARSAMAAGGAAEARPKVEAAIAAYRAVVLRFPASGYCDNALWLGASLALDAYDRYAVADDRQTGQDLLQWLRNEYPSSRLAKDVPVRIAHLNAPHAPKPAPAAAAGTPAAAPPKPVETAASAPASSPAPATTDASDRALVTIRDIHRSVLPESVRIVIDMDGEVPFHDEHIENPERIFVDLAGTRAAPPLVDRAIRFESDNDVVRQVRLGRHENHTTRVVLDAANVSTYTVYALYNPYRLVIDCGRADAAAQSSPRPWTPGSFGRPAVPPVLAVRTTMGGWAPTVPAAPPLARTLVADAHAALDAPPAPAALPVLATTPAANTTGGFSIARQLGLGVSRIVIDPGHGGHDPGAQGKGISEADLVLDVSLRLEKLLRKVPGMEVILTRRTDEFIALPERTAIANREGADLFLSIHANASRNPSARGIETYFLNFANNQSAAAVAARENAESAQAMGALPDYVKAIALNNKLDESRDFAAMVQKAMVTRLRGGTKGLRDLGVKQAPFVVLIGAAMPSVLAEISFVTNAQDARLLKSGAYRQRIAEALFNAIRKYQTSLKNVTTVAQQE